MDLRGKNIILDEMEKTDGGFETLVVPLANAQAEAVRLLEEAAPGLRAQNDANLKFLHSLPDEKDTQFTSPAALIKINLARKLFALYQGNSHLL